MLPYIQNPRESKYLKYLAQRKEDLLVVFEAFQNIVIWKLTAGPGRQCSSIFFRGTGQIG